MFLKNKRLALDVHMRLRNLPKPRSHLSSLHLERPTLTQSSQQAPSDHHILCQLAHSSS